MSVVSRNADNIREELYINGLEAMRREREAELQRAQQEESNRLNMIQPVGHDTMPPESPTKYNEVIDHPDFKYACEWLCIEQCYVRSGISHTWCRNFRDGIRVHRNWKVDGKIIPSDTESGQNVLVIYGNFIASSTDRIMLPRLYEGTEYTWEWRLDSSRNPSLVIDYALESML